MTHPAFPQGFRSIAGRTATALALVVAATSLTGCTRKTPPPVEPTPPRVAIAPVVARTDILDYEDFTGRIDAFRAVTIRPQVTGMVTGVHFDDGEFVKKGDPLFDIDPSIFKSQYDSALAAVRQAEAAVDQAKAQLESANARKVQYQVAFDLVQKSFTAGTASIDARNQAEADYKAAIAAVDVAQATQKVGQASLGSAIAALDLAHTRLGYTTIRAEYDGRLSRRMVDPGNIIRENETALTTLMVLDQVYVSFDIDERTLLKIRKLIRDGKIATARASQLKVQVWLSEADIYPDPFSALLTFADNALDQNTGTLRLRAEMDNPVVRDERFLHYRPGSPAAITGVAAALRAEDRITRLFSPGMFVRVRLPVGKPHSGILVPEEAFGSEQGRKFVYVVRNATNTGQTETREEERDGQRQKVDYFVYKGTPELRWVTPGVQIDLPGPKRPVPHRAVDDVASTDQVVVAGLQRIRKDKDGKFTEMTWLVRKPTTN